MLLLLLQVCIVVNAQCESLTQECDALKAECDTLKAAEQVRAAFLLACNTIRASVFFAPSCFILLLCDIIVLLRFVAPTGA